MEKDDSYINVAHVTANGSDDALHYIYTSFGAPTVFVAKTSLNATLDFNLTRFVSENVTDRYRSLNFTGGTPDAALALVFTEVKHCGFLSVILPVFGLNVVSSATAK